MKIVPPLLVVALLATALPGEAQQAGKVPRVGLLEYPATRPGWTEPLVRTDFIRQALRDVGYLEGQNVLVETMSANTRDFLPQLAANFVGLNVAVIVATGVEAAQAAKAVTTTIPVVMVSLADPVELGLVASLARPGGNVTGVSLIGAELGEKRLALVKEAVGRGSRVAVLWNPSDAAAVREWSQIRAAAPRLGVTLISAEYRGTESIDALFASARNARAGALVVVLDPLTYAQGTRIVELAAKYRLPAIYGSRAFVERGGLMAYQPSTRDMGRRVAILVDKILKGARPRDLPVEQLGEFELVVNMKTAKALGLQLPPSVLVLAEQIFR